MMVLDMVIGVAAGAVFVALCGVLLAQLGGRKLESLKELTPWALSLGGAVGAALGLVVGATYDRLGLPPLTGGGLASGLLWLLAAVTAGVVSRKVFKREGQGH